MLSSFVNDYFLWIKAIHIIAMVAWMAGLFYLPRLFVYHVESPAINKDTFVLMEEKLYRVIMTPAMHTTLLFGFLMLMDSAYLKEGWMHLKITCVGGLVAFQFWLNQFRKQLREGGCTKSGKFFRMINEIPTFLLIIIVICVVIKPF